tara:strand:+ start:2969 stop:3922 length:954 start_codon:yes stop_codon:yes gene_type:complete
MKEKESNYRYLEKIDAKKVFDLIDKKEKYLYKETSFLGEPKKRNLKFKLDSKRMKKIRHDASCFFCGLEGNVFYIVCTLNGYPNNPFLQLFHENETECISLRLEPVPDNYEHKAVCQRCTPHKHKVIDVTETIDRERQKEVIVNQYISWKKYEIEHIFSLIGTQDYLKERIFYEPTKQTFNFRVNLGRKKLGIFKRNHYCVKCRLEGNVIRLVSQHDQPPMETASLQLFHEDDKTGRQVLMTLDHVIPVAQGGLNNADNLQTMCEDCNNKKGAKIDEQHVQKLLKQYNKKPNLTKMDLAKAEGYPYSLNKKGDTILW